MEINQRYTQYREFAENSVRHVLTILESEQKRFSVVQMKDAVDLATSADIKAEQWYIEQIHKNYPDHQIQSEEAGSTGQKSAYCWVIDPLDGTKEYTKGSKQYNTLISLEQNNSLIACAIGRSDVNDVYSSSFGGGSFIHDQQIFTSGVSQLDMSFISFHLPTAKKGVELVHKDIEILERLIHAAYRVRSFSDDAWALCQVSQGILDAHILPQGLNKWHDIASGILLVCEAGGTVTDAKGVEVKDNNFQDYLVASNGKLHTDLLRCIQSTIL